MKQLTTFLGLLFLLSTTDILAQSVGDYQSAAGGDWSTAATWEVWNGSAWDPASNPPTGSENITVDDSVNVDAAVTINGYVMLSGSGKIEIGAGSLTFGNGSTYEHAVNGGVIPTATWDSVSTCLISGATGNAPGNANQDFYNFTWNCTAQSSNLNLAWSGNTISGDLSCLSTNGSNQFRLSNNTAYSDSITIKGDVVVSSGVLTSTGSSGAQNYLIIVEGDIVVTGGTFGLSRGSGGIATWRLFGDLNVSNAEIRTSNTDSKFVFARIGTQNLALQSVTYTSTWDYEILSFSTLRIVDGPDPYDLEVGQNFINGGNVISDGVVHFQNGANYQHIVNSGTVPIGVWETGSTATFTGITSVAPANRNQSFYNVVWDCPDQSSNLNMGFDEITIGGDITIVNTGASNRWYLCGPSGGDSATVTINGNITQSGGQFSSNGSGNAAFIEITVNGDINVTSGNFAVSRGSQGGTGTTKWYLKGTNFSMSDATTQNSNAAGAKFIFSGSSKQNLTLTNINFAGGFPVEVAPGAILDAGASEIGGNGIFTLNDGATLQTANIAGLDSTVKTSGTVTLGNAANYTFNGSAAQVTGVLLPITVNNLSVDNSAGVTLSGDVTVNGNLTLTNGDLDLNGHIVTLGSTALLVESTGNTVTGGSGKISVVQDLNAPVGVNVGGLGAMITSSADLGSTMIERHPYAGKGNGNQGINRIYNIVPTNNTGLNSTLRLYYDESELNGISEANLQLFKSPSAADNTWGIQGGTVNEAENYVEISGIDGFSYWTLADVGAPIPVELVFFTASVNDKGVLLSWTTAAETNNYGWNVQRKRVIENQDEQTWQKIYFVEGSGSSTSEKEYTFTDNSVTSGKYQYRLQQVDYDGTVSYSKLVEVEVELIPDKFALYQNYPNPFNPSTVIKYDVPLASFINITIYNTIGEKVAILINEQVDAGVHFVQFDASNLPSGIYIYKLTGDNISFINKMMLIK